MAQVTINGKEYTVQDGMTIIQACEIAGIEIPRFCYHDRLHIAGNCRMCLVEVKGGPPKPVASCAMPVANGQVIFTNSPMVKKAREGVMEFLLINHPLDCPICDQGGECDLQDQAMAYGRGKNRYHENKRAVVEKYMGPLIKTHMTRCIHCTRCIRFAEEVAGVPELGAIGRGEDMQVTTYVEKAISSELSGNLVDLCPVGALTSRPYAFTARPWELKKTESIDVLDAVGSNIRVDSRGLAVMRVLPRLNEEINEEWISDKTRHACDGLLNQRLDKPMVRKNGKLQPASWDEAFAAIAKRIKGVDPKRIAALAGNLADAESMLLLKELFKKIGSQNMDCRIDGAQIDNKSRGNYLFNTTIAGIEEADALLIIGANPRVEAPIVNQRIRKRWRAGKFPIARIGAAANLTYDYEDLGDTPEILSEIASGKHAFAKVLKSAKKPMIIVGASAYTRVDYPAIFALIGEICDAYDVVQDKWNGFNILHTAASRVGGLDIGFVPGARGLDASGILEAARKGDMEVVYLLGADEIDTAALKKTFVIYQGHHGDAGAHAADVILPGAAYTEKSATYVNLEGRAQRTTQAVFPPGQAREDWRILADLATALGFDFGYKSVRQVRDALVQQSEFFVHLGEVKAGNCSFPKKGGKLLSEPFAEFITNFYMTDSISRASKTMAACTAEILGSQKEAA